MLSSDETGWLPGDYLMAYIPKDGADTCMVASTVVSSRMLAAIAAHYGTHRVKILTTFKWLARAEQDLSGRTSIYTHEEAIGCWHLLQPLARSQIRVQGGALCCAVQNAEFSYQYAARPFAQNFWFQAIAQVSGYAERLSRWPAAPAFISNNPHGSRRTLGPAMKFALASYGTRGDVEPCVVAGRELLRRGHEVRMAVPPNLVGFVESAGLAAVAYGPDSRVALDKDFFRNLWEDFPRNLWRIHDLIRFWREAREFGTQCWGEMSTTLMSLADGADLLCHGMMGEQPAANVAEYYGIPLATLHWFPARVNGQFPPFLPAPLVRTVMTAAEWRAWRVVKKVEDAQRGELGLPKATGPAPRRITERGSLEIQAYDEVCFPGLAAEWAKWNGQRPFVGPLTIELPTAADEEVVSWVAAGTPPIYFGFGSIPVQSPADALTMIGAACARLGERALVCAGWSDFSRVADFDHVKVVDTVNHAAIFPACRAVVHHGGAGTTAAGLRAGVPTLILWTFFDQPLWGDRVKRLKVGTARRFSITTLESLVWDLRTILAPQYVTRAREIAARMTKPAASVAAAADLVEDFARWRRVG